MRKTFEQEEHRPKEFVRSIDIATGCKNIDDSDSDEPEPASCPKYSPIRAVAAAADADSSFLHDIGDQSDSQLGLCNDELQSKTLSIQERIVLLQSDISSIQSQLDKQILEKQAKLKSVRFQQLGVEFVNSENNDVEMDPVMN